MEAVWPFKILVLVSYHTNTQCHGLEDHNITFITMKTLSLAEFQLVSYLRKIKMTCLTYFLNSFIRQALY
jgi:hypothetical protein